MVYGVKIKKFKTINLNTKNCTVIKYVDSRCCVVKK